ncbi:dTDP-4-dehydrorhamnose reductase [Microcella alkaliphila]|uniref:dTDP-4-dehydrorhamnose reductase n=1 Tax=Microcella alkaliphila TaxID=279828 RepID=A0A0U4NY49_9MICO|nr:dTDP-4-dehydrorhamnose reductase [Microcella alkaliphila]BAU33139.1 dTDP-sugar reductase [Microcella alkaliphila]
MTRILITGAGGMLGRDLQTALGGRAVTAATRADLDITDVEAAADAVAGHGVVVNCAAYTAVDAAESDEQAAHLINATGAENLARASARHGARLIQLSTDYVFAGDATTPYSEDAPLAPVSAYGRTKADGERLARAAHPAGTIIVRTAWLYGQHGPNFAATMLRLAAERETLTVVDDQRGQPTWTADLAAQIVALIDSPVTSGVFHGTAAGETTWFGFARAVFENAGLDPERVQPTDSSSFVRPAPRPAYSVLGHDAWAAEGLPTPRNWRAALDAAFAAGAVRTP